MKKNLLLTLIIFFCLAAMGQNTGKNPNIVIYLVDGMGWQDTSVPFWKERTHRNRVFNTPNMELMALEGVKFTHAYTTNSNHESAKTAILSGRYTWARNTPNSTIGETRHSLTVEDILTRKGYRCVSVDNSVSDNFISTLDLNLAQIHSDRPFFAVITESSIVDSECRKLPFYRLYREAGIADQDACSAAHMQKVDEHLGDIMDYLKSKEIADNTVIIVVSTNSKGGVASGNKFANFPLNQGGESMYEGGIRIPLIIKSPNGMKSGVCATPTNLLDIMPTVLEMAGVAKSEIPQKLYGNSLVPLLVDPQSRPSKFNRSLYWHNPAQANGAKSQVGKGYGASSVIVSGDWKLIYYYETGKTELFNLKDDIFEIVDQSESIQIAYTRKRLTNNLTRFLRRSRVNLELTEHGKPYKYPNGDRFDKDDILPKNGNVSL